MMTRVLKMMRAIPSQVLGGGKAAVLALVVALTVGTATGALAATGGNFILGRLNTADASTSLVGAIADATKATLALQNSGGGPALSLGVNSGKAPLTVSSGAGTATNLSADKLDGKDSTEFAPAGTSGGKAADSDLLDGKDSTEFALAADAGGKAFHAEGTTSTPGLITAKALPKGDYVIIANADGSSADAKDDDVEGMTYTCRIQVEGGSELARAHETTGDDLAGSAYEGASSVSMTTVHSVTDNFDNIQLYCDAFGGAPGDDIGTGFRGTITAIKVGSIDKN